MLLSFSSGEVTLDNQPIGDTQVIEDNIQVS